MRHNLAKFLANALPARSTYGKEVLYIFFSKCQRKKKSKGEKKNMCETLNRLDGKTPDELLKEYFVYSKSKGMPLFPINIETILEMYDITPKMVNFSEFEKEKIVQKSRVREEGEKIIGSVSLEGDDLRMLYDEKSPPHRKRFTLAHELAHCCLHADKLRETAYDLTTQKDIDFFEERKEIEMEDMWDEWDANVFAGAILIPDDDLKFAYKRMLRKDEKIDIDLLANIFDVSDSVMKERIRILGLNPIVS